MFRPAPGRCSWRRCGDRGSRQTYQLAPRPAATVERRLI